MLLHDFYTLIAGSVIGGAAGAALALWIRSRRTTRQTPHQYGELLATLHAMDDALQEVSPAALQARGEWDRAQFDDVLRRVEALTPAFQNTLVDLLSRDTQPDRPQITALLAVDRLSAAYTYWTRLFPPRQSNEAMFVLSLLHDLGEKVGTAIQQIKRPV